MIEMTKEIIATVSAVIGVLVTAVPFLISLIRKAKQLIKERNWTKIMSIMPMLITEAEKFTNYAGAEKKEYVKSRLAVYALNNKIAFDEAKFDEAIDGIVTLTKEVNKREKDKTSPISTLTNGVLPLMQN